MPQDNSSVPELMMQFMARNAAKALEAMGECEAAFRIRQGENEELRVAVAEKRVGGMKVEEEGDSQHKGNLEANLKKSKKKSDKSKGL